ncbi:MAG: amylo-alpha-1,6-glucosidase [Eubacteriales bacterium]|nr:amylo-alpha-1,6-glucosidase [Eubacteriales bacterium]
MKVRLGRFCWQDFRRGQETCFLLTNGLGGYSSLTVAGDTARNDHALFMAAEKAPNKRIQLISNVAETLIADGEEISLYSQEFVNRTKNAQGFRYLEGFEMEAFPTWFYRIKGIEIEKTIVMLQGENTLAIRYQVRNSREPGNRLFVTPLLRFAPKGKNPDGHLKLQADEKSVTGNGRVMYYSTNGIFEKKEQETWTDLYYEQDARDGRDAVGAVVLDHRIRFEIREKEQVFYLVYSLDRPVDDCSEITIEKWISEEIQRRREIVKRSGLQSDAGRTLALSASQYVVARESTGGKSIIAGYPYFEDWGRDTMIALPGCTLAVGDYEGCKSILRTFMAYCRKGLMPNLFPEGDREPLYNTVDAALLFIDSVYQYFTETKDSEFLKDAYPVMEEIIYWYRKGTNFHIKMDEDGLIMAGEGPEQLTWMDVRIGEELPTPRHGKPVEINAYWYNALKIMEELSSLVKTDGSAYGQLAGRVRKSFLEKFWMEEKGWLKDVVNGTQEEEKFRCNQVFALALPYKILAKEQGQRVLSAVKKHLYTTAGLRSLSPQDSDFHPWYGGSQADRDRAYHQGTVWTFPLGAYYRAVLAYAENPEAAKQEVKRGLDQVECWLYEGCLFHLAEIYDGENPVISKGCYGQAWSVGEILRVYKMIEHKC